MTLWQQLATIGAVVAGTALTRFLPFLCFPAKRRVLPAVFGLLVVYCFREVSLFEGSHAIPELIAVLVVVLLHRWKRQMLLSIAGGTLCYMALVQLVF